MASAHPHDAALEELYAFGMAYPGAHPKSPWPGHRDLAVKDKTFAYLSLPGEALGISCKLPASCNDALNLPFASPTEYGLGKSGWVSARFGDDDSVPVELLKAWIDESYRAQAPKRLSAGAPAYPSGSSTGPDVRAVASRQPRSLGTSKKAGKKRRGPATAASGARSGKTQRRVKAQSSGVKAESRRVKAQTRGAKAESSGAKKPRTTRAPARSRKTSAAKKPARARSAS